uniref:Uncharacterized protein n=1 Tax=Lepeophtheirus salmonis TaxID=72036 RepID=A0A0K2V5Z3_LEPSM
MMIVTHVKTWKHSRKTHCCKFFFGTSPFSTSLCLHYMSRYHICVIDCIREIIDGVSQYNFVFLVTANARRANKTSGRFLFTHNRNDIIDVKEE